MYLLRYEKESLKDYMVYDMPDNFLLGIINTDNGFQMCYLNNENIIIKLYFKISFVNKNINNCIEELLYFINNKFQSTNDNWTILKNERMIDKNHYTSLYFFSNKYCIELYKLRKIIDNLYISSFYFDVSIYYTFNSKYREMITVILPNQSNKYFKFTPIYKIYMGDISNIIITNIDNLNMLEM
jgi:hypothetical protein